MKTHVIFDNYNTDIDDYSELFEEIERERADEYDADEYDADEIVELCTLTDNEKYDIFYRELDVWLDAERANLDVQLPQEIIAIADLGLWDGRRTGYKIIKSGNIRDILQSDCDYVSWTCDRYNVHGVGHHHDGTNYVLYRTFKDNTTEEQKKRLCDALYNGTVNERMIRRYTRSIAPEVKKVYGW